MVQNKDDILPKNLLYCLNTIQKANTKNHPYDYAQFTPIFERMLSSSRRPSIHEFGNLSNLMFFLPSDFNKHYIERY